MNWSELADNLNRTTRDVFGESITFAGRWGDPVSVDTDGEPLTGVFDRDHETVNVADGQVVSTTEPVLFIRGGDLAFEPIVGEKVVIRGQDWIILDVRPDGHGGYKLALELTRI